MLPARSRSVLAAALAAVLLSATLVSAHGTEPASSPATSGSEMITTRLHPGWNSVGWIGAEAHAAELFDAIPMLLTISAWDSEEHRYEEVIRTSTPRRDIGALTPGRALWLYVAGEAPIEWRRRASADGVLLSLQAGLNFVGWSGRDGATIEDAVARFGDALSFVARWNAETRRYEYYDPAARDAANTLQELHRGDALWVELSGDARWWQSEAARTDFVFRANLSPQRQADLRAMMANVVTFFAERYGIEPPPFSVIVDLELETSASPGVIRLGQFYHPSLSVLEGTLAHEYFHVLQSHLSRRGAFSPRWMSEGTAHYAEGLYNASRGASTDEKVRTQWWLGSQIPETLRAIEQAGPFFDTGAGGYNTGALATDWLVRRAAAAPAGGVSFTPFEPGALDEQAAHDSYIEYYRLLPSSASWREAFRTAFGITTHDFYTAFEAYRAALIGIHLPHRADDREEPILVLVGDIPPDTAADLRAQFGTLQALFTERFGDVPADYTIFVAADAESAAPMELRLFGDRSPTERCDRPFSGMFVLATLTCRASLPDYLGRFHFESARDRLAPSGSLPPRERGYGLRGPLWLDVGMKAYADYLYQVAAGIGEADRLRSLEVSSASWIALPLSGMATGAGLNELGASSLAFLAVEWLADQAGGPALFEYYRLLPSSRSWREAFEGAFGLSAGDFYEAFDLHLREAVPPLPHLADDRLEPILVFLGDLPPAVEAAFRADFADAQRFFVERLGAGPADYTVYIAADGDAAEATVLRLFGVETDPGFCLLASDNVALIMTPTCGESLAHHLGPHHYRDVVRRLAPWELLPTASLAQGLLGEYSPWGPYWLGVATSAYVEYAYRAAEGLVDLDQIRRSSRASVSAHTLRSLDAEPAYEVRQALGFLAGDWLAARSGETAIFEYYRLLPSSTNWQDAFETAFGITIDDFYERFAAYRAALP